MDELNAVRQKIDEIDSNIIKLLTERFEEVKKVAEIKKNLNMKSEDSKRWEEVLRSRAEIAESLGLDRELIERIYILIHEHSVRMQDKLNETS